MSDVRRVEIDGLGIPWAVCSDGIWRTPSASALGEHISALAAENARLREAMEHASQYLKAYGGRPLEHGYMSAIAKGLDAALKPTALQPSEP